MTQPYGAVVLEHFRRPRNQRSLEQPTVAREGFNPVCGDRVRIEIEVRGGTIAGAAFTANACAICTASASLLTERIHGQPLAHVAGMTETDALSWLDTDLPPARLTCGVLPLRTLLAALAQLPAAQ